jgi:K+-sensing histidine kinase KdpD
MNAEEVRQSINSSLEVYHLRKKNQQILQELEEANAELLNMDGLKSEIINSISAEISNPLNRIMGTLHLLKTKIEGDELTEVVNILDNSVFKLEQFSMLAQQISMLKSPGFQLKKSSVSLKQVIQFGSIETREELKEQGITLKRDTGADDQLVTGDSGLLVSCLVSLIRFAREHTNNHGEIRIECPGDDAGIVCTVADQGVNYNNTLSELLETHYSTREAPLNLTMGIGLAVSQMIMEAHGGHLVFARGKDNEGLLKMVFPHE